MPGSNPDSKPTGHSADANWSLGAGLEGKGVVVTGAAGGIGREVVKAFDAVGARVLAVDRTEDLALSALDGLDGLADGRHHPLGADLTDPSSADLLVQTATARLGGLYVLTHLAAVLRRRAQVKDVTEEDWDTQVDTNLKATFFLCRAAASAMAAAGAGGRIISFTSQGWWTGGFGGSVVYNATKGGIVTMMRGLARTYAPDGITVNSVAPGQVRTPMLLSDLDPEVLETMTQATPLGRIAEPEEMAGTVVFLASRHASFITGATINVTGGFLMY